MNWQQFVLENEVGIRLGFFFGIFGVMVVWELLAPRRALTVSKTLRWVNNLGPMSLTLRPNSLFCRKISSIHHHLKESEMNSVPAVPTTDQAVLPKII